MGEYIQAGGSLMWPLLFLALISLAIVLERIVFWTRLRRRQNRAQLGAEEFLAIRRYKASLDMILSSAPLLGILGTVLQIGRTFQGIAASGLPDSRALLVGVAGALTPTVLGLVLALFTLIAVQLLERQANRAQEVSQKYAAAAQPPEESRPQPQHACPDEPAKINVESPIRRGASLGGLSEKEKRFFLS